MSGGHFDYKYSRIADLAEELRAELEKAGTKGEFDYSKPTLAMLREFVQALLATSDIAREVERLYSGDHGEESFRKLMPPLISRLRNAAGSMDNYS